MSILVHIKNKYRGAYYRLIKYITDPLIRFHLRDKWNWEALHCDKKGISDNKYCQNPIIVSLTTYGDRLYDVHLTIETIMQGSMLPNRIILWLAEEEKDRILPIPLQKQIKRGLDVKYTKDLRSYKKFIPALKDYPNGCIITIDDDLFYESDIVEKLVNEHIKHPNYILANRVRHMSLDKKGNLRPYTSWRSVANHTAVSVFNFITSGGGALFPPGCFNDDVLDEDVFMDICRYADDIWFTCMALHNGTPIKKVYTHNKNGDDFVENQAAQVSALSKINVEGQKNDVQIKAVFAKYNLYDKLK